MLDLSTFHLMPLISSLVINTIVTWLVVHFFTTPKAVAATIISPSYCSA